MVNTKETDVAEYKKIAEVICRLLDFNSEIQERIQKHFEEYGVAHFFENLEVYSFSQDKIKKQSNLRVVLYRFSKEAEMYSAKTDPRGDGL